MTIPLSTSPRVTSPEASLYTGFDHTDTPIGPDGTPYEFFEALRDEARTSPIGWSETHGGFWVAARYDVCDEIIQNHLSYSNAAVIFPRYATGQDSQLKIAGQDEPSHKRDRSFVNFPFSPKQVAKYDVAVREMTNKLIDGFIEDGEADVGRLLGEEIPCRLTARLLGLPEEEGETYRRWVWEMTHGHKSDADQAALVVAEMHEYFGQVLRERKRNPGDDVLSLVTQAVWNGERFTDDDLLGFCIVLLLGGIENSTKSFNASFWRLGWDKELRRRVIAKPSMVTSFFDEILRYYSPGVIGRLVLDRDITVADVVMKEGEVVVLALPVANRDGVQFANPDVFIPERTPNRHLALGGGIHRCLGTHLLRVEARAALNTFLERIPDYDLHPMKKSTWANGQVQGMATVPIVFPPRAPAGAR